MPTFPKLALFTPHPGIVIDRTESTAIIGHKNQDGIPIYILFLQKAPKRTDLSIQISNHSEKANDILSQIFGKCRQLVFILCKCRLNGLAIFGRHKKWGVRGIGRQESKKGF